MPVPSLQQLAVQKVPRQDLRRLLQSAELPESLVSLIRQALTTLRQWKAKFRPSPLSLQGRMLLGAGKLQRWAGTPSV